MRPDDAHGIVGIEYAVESTCCRQFTLALCHHIVSHAVIMQPICFFMKGGRKINTTHMKPQPIHVATVPSAAYCNCTHGKMS